VVGLVFFDVAHASVLASLEAEKSVVQEDNRLSVKTLAGWECLHHAKHKDNFLLDVEYD